VWEGRLENLRTSLAQAVAEELCVSMDCVSMVLGDTDLTPYDRGTFGSRSTPVMSQKLRRAAAALRRILEERAAESWSVARKALSVADGRVVHAASGRSATLGELTRGEKTLETIEDDEQLSPPNAWTVLGKPALGLDTPRDRRTFLWTWPP
jgi:isoquinoline 1-oxidoreductase